MPDPLARDRFAVGQSVRLSSEGIARGIHLGTTGKGIVTGFSTTSLQTVQVKADGQRTTDWYHLWFLEPDEP